MQSTRIFYSFLCFFLLSFTVTNAQLDDPRFVELEEKLETYSKDHANLRQKIDITAVGTIQEIITAIAQQTKINITIAPDITEPMVSNFSKVRVQDLLIYLCKQYNLDLAFSGSIITVYRYQQPNAPPKPKEAGVKYNAYNSFLTLDLVNDTLSSVARAITQQSGENVVVSLKAKDKAINGFYDKVSIERGLELMALANDLKLIKDENGTFYITTKDDEELVFDEGRKKRPRNPVSGGINYEEIENLDIYIYEDTAIGEWLVDVEAINVPFLQVIKGVSIEMGKDYFLFDTPQGVVNPPSRNNGGSRNSRTGLNGATGNGMSLKLEGATYTEFLNYILKGTELTYKIDNDIFLIGDRNMEGLRETKVIQLQYRSASEIQTVIPPELSEKVNVEPFLELNSIILSGSAPNIAEVEQFIKDIDKLVPVVQIELIVMDVQRNRLTETGIEMGVGDAPAQSGGILSPGFEFTFGAESINRLLELLGGRGIVNLGRVVPNFYVSLKAVEEAGIIKTRSQPQLATLNSHPASFNIGETRYYQETRTTVQGVQGTVTQRDISFQSVQANFSINITPFVSGDEQVTLDIVVEQSDFLGEIQLGAPPAQFSRTFDSKIRIKNGDMIVLGGLENERRENTSSGVPFLARIPIVNLFFGRKRNVKSDSELLIFIKPTIVY